MRCCHYGTLQWLTLATSPPLVQDVRVETQMREQQTKTHVKRTLQKRLLATRSEVLDRPRNTRCTLLPKSGSEDWSNSVRCSQSVKRHRTTWVCTQRLESKYDASEELVNTEVALASNVDHQARNGSVLYDTDCSSLRDTYQRR